jgi:glycosyltransferase involved in cell wall biosynthesis
MPQVSICIPTYNGAPYLEECLESAVGQTFVDMEILVVDDCSDDDTVALAGRFVERDPRVRLLTNRERLGLVRNWNRCLQYAAGEWVKFLFQDDVLAEGCVERMLHAAKTDTGKRPTSLVVCERRFAIEAGVADGLRQFYTSSVITLRDVFPGGSHILPEELSEAILSRGVGCNFIGEPTSVMVRRSLCLQHEPFNQDLVHLCDLEYWTRLGTNDGLTYLPDKLVVFRVHNRSASAHNHRCNHFQLEYLDKIILLHDYLYHPSYFNFRRAKDSELLLHRQLEATLAGLAHARAVRERQDRHLLPPALAAKYPMLKKLSETFC